MRHGEFETGKTFRTGAGLWRTTDIGTRTIVAMRIDQVEVEECPLPIHGWPLAARGGEVDVRLLPDPRKRRVLGRSQAEAEGWFNGPPYAVAEQVFDEHGMKGCWMEDGDAGEQEK
jgi:hypothetical protein